MQIFWDILKDLKIGGNLLHGQIELLFTDLRFGILALLCQEEEGLLQEFLQIVPLLLLEIIVQVRVHFIFRSLLELAVDEFMQVIDQIIKNQQVFQIQHLLLQDSVRELE